MDSAINKRTQEDYFKVVLRRFFQTSTPLGARKYNFYDIPTNQPTNQTSARHGRSYTSNGTISLAK